MGNPDTGAIGYFETDEDARAAGYKVPLMPRQAEEFFPLPRDERKRLFQEMADEASAKLIAEAEPVADARSLEERIAESVRVLAAAGEVAKGPGR